jgi:Flp pilus assembly protein TadD
LALAPRDAKALNNRGVALAALGDGHAARQDFERALVVDPCFAEARRNLNQLGTQAETPPQCR